MYLRNAADKRAKQLQLALPDGLDLMVICAEAGLSLDATLVRVSRELGNTWPELAEEFGITAAELTFLPDRRTAFDNLNNRTDSDGIRGVVNTLQQTAKFGTPLAQSLRVLAAEFRDTRMFKAEEKAARLPALMTVPMILFILPTLFIVLMGPAALGIIDTFNHGGSGGGPKEVTVITHKDDDEDAAPKPQDTKITEIRADDGDDKDKDAEPVPVAAAPTSTITLAQPSVAVGVPFTIAVDARPLIDDFDLHILIVPEETPASVADPEKFFSETKTVTATESNVELTARTAGPSEIRLYYVPHFATTYAVAARAKLEVTPK
jgi:hypothetical protein